MPLHRAMLAACCLLVLAQTGFATRLEDAAIHLGGARRMLRGAANVTSLANITETQAEAIKDVVSEADGEAGEYTDWVMACQGGRDRCPNLFLASWGYQCMSRDEDSCCLQPNGRFCTRLRRWRDEDDIPASWAGDYAADVEAETSTSDADSESGSQDSTNDEQEEEDKEEERRRQEERRKQERQQEEEWEEREEQQQREEERNSGGRWRKAAATYYNSYPRCCYDRHADQTECREYNGCQWAGYFAAFNERKSREWVQANNIVALFSSGDKGAWHSRWKGKRLRIKNPRSGKTLDVQVVDTCADSDCGCCCTRNAARNGGFLIDLEYNTALRFWSGRIDGSAEIEWQEL